jgi:hypothetical protein
LSSIATPLCLECCTHSPANRGGAEDLEGEQAASLAEIWKHLGYVRARRPRAVVVENVDERSIAGPLTGLLSKLGGYSVRTGVLTPEEVAGAPITRTRRFWVLVSDEARQARMGEPSS